MRSVLGAFKLGIYLLLTLICMPVQIALRVMCRGPIIYKFPKFYHGLCCRIFNIKVIIEGDIETGDHVVYAGNHLSYLDITVLGSVLPAAFIAKRDVASWPLFGILAKLQNTLFISRDPKDAEAVKKAFEKRLECPLPLILFPEGTSSNGTKILPFKSSMFEIFLNKNIKIQPFTLSLLAVDGKSAADDTQRDLYAYYGDTVLAPHLWRFSKLKGVTLKVTFQKKLSTNSFNDRKSLCTTVHEGVMTGLDLSPIHA
jgi:lyso-ornithine lipid O-acyltransferase